MPSEPTGDLRTLDWSFGALTRPARRRLEGTKSRAAQRDICPNRLRSRQAVSGGVTVDLGLFPVQTAARTAARPAPGRWYEATTMCANQGKVLCGVEQPCINRGCSYNRHYQWTGQECQAGDAGLPAACASA